MIKKTLYFENPAYLSMKNKQLVIKISEVEKNDTLPDSFKEKNIKTIPIEDIGVIIFDHRQITYTNGLMGALIENNCAVITCGDNRMPIAITLPLDSNTVQSERFRSQIEASLPLKKQLWQQTVQAKISNQAYVLRATEHVIVKNMQIWVDQVKSGDTDNHEGRAAVYYWNNMFSAIKDFRRGRDGAPPNNLLNYGYAILRAIVARALVSSGLLPTFGIHHCNRYNAYCLADDIMEPYRPFVDKLVAEIVDSGDCINELTKDIKIKMLNIPVLDVIINGQRSPLMIAASQTTASLARCYSGEIRKISYPSFE
jgi:CRISPR-associated protein Cas1